MGRGRLLGGVLGGRGTWGGVVVGGSLGVGG